MGIKVAIAKLEELQQAYPGAARFGYTICEAYPLGQGYNVKIHMSRVLSGKLPTQKPTPQKPPQLRFT